jgi:L-serine deaminase
MLVLPHKDKPGMIAQLATLLSKENNNISMMQVGRKIRDQVGGESVMIIDVDESVSDKILKQLQKIDGIYGARYINLRVS